MPSVKPSRKVPGAAENQAIGDPGTGMGKRIDRDGDGSRDELQEALRQLQRPRRPTAEKPTEEVKEAVRELAEQQRAAAERRPRPGRPARLTWAGIAFILIAVVVIAVILGRPEPPPPPATSAQEAVRGFWRSLIAGKYEAAAFYCSREIVDKYGSRKQAGERLKEQFGSNPPVRVVKIGEPEQLPDSSDLRVTYEVYLRSGTPRSGDAIVTDSGDPKVGYVIRAGL
jgi:hypothetical protein